MGDRGLVERREKRIYDGLVYIAWPVKTNLQKEIMLNLSVYKNYLKKNQRQTKNNKRELNFLKEISFLVEFWN